MDLFGVVEKQLKLSIKDKEVELLKLKGLHAEFSERRKLNRAREMLQNELDIIDNIIIGKNKMSYKQFVDKFEATFYLKD